MPNRADFGRRRVSQLVGAAIRIASQLGAQVEETMGNLARLKRIAIRCEKTDALAIFSLTRGLIRVKSVHAV